MLVAMELILVSEIIQILLVISFFVFGFFLAKKDISAPQAPYLHLYFIHTLPFSYTCSYLSAISLSWRNHSTAVLLD